VVQSFQRPLTNWDKLKNSTPIPLVKTMAGHKEMSSILADQ
jgi:hypothetical protein